MKVLVMYVDEFSYNPAQKNLDEVVDITEGATFTDSILAFIQVEESDEEKDVKSREKKLVNHLKWTARKNNCKSVILHSFAHLSESKASVNFTKELFDQAEIRLQNADFTTAQTPFGYFLDLNIKAPGFSLARIWATL
ncbi:threonyl-tRNA synthetase editing domain-containing protein [Draconibacterium sp. IB214405]|uniref:threonyl-tRNA synthetase editing domain-containing protein n=1 Tax=Draconibacterium sp. IB214405 TaxID=3097352 RepID=UPI002A12C3F6|nr:threonyl-tRNA synthetase editing domain-containing protein [Draconibacterium sp. IB214405]MDX8340092.1 threonyl-tRNA synthetase editing domain-containing protein [Draconibacterium sp. IB214405]